MVEKSLDNLIHRIMFTQFKIQKFSKKKNDWYTVKTFSECDLALNFFTLYPEYRVCCTNQSGIKVILQHKN